MHTITHQNSIKMARETILRAVDILNDRSVAVAEVRRVFKNCDKRGMYKQVERASRDVIALATAEGLSAKKPYKIVREKNGLFVKGIVSGLHRPFVAYLYGIEKR